MESRKELQRLYQNELDKTNSVYRIIPFKRLYDIEKEILSQQVKHNELYDYNTYADTSYDFRILDNPEIKSLFRYDIMGGEKARREVQCPLPEHHCRI